jgi:hypothetical protein
MAACDEPVASGVALPVGVALPPAGVTPPAANCDGRVKTGGDCDNCDVPSSSACCGAPSMVARMASFPNSSRRGGRVVRTSRPVVAGVEL